MTIKKILSTLCLLVTTALANTPVYTPTGSIRTGNNSYPMGLAFDNSGTLYVTTGTGQNTAGFSVFSPTTGQLTSYVYDLLVDPNVPYYSGLAISGSTLYLPNTANYNGTTYPLGTNIYGFGIAAPTNPPTPALTITGLNGPYGLAISGNNLYVANGGGNGVVRQLEMPMRANYNCRF